MIKSDWISIRYRSFYDLPRMIVLERGGRLFLLNCAFDESQDDYSDHYVVYRLRTNVTNRVDKVKDWTELLASADRLGTIPVKNIEFDETKRHAVADRGLELLI